jgi:hypothetical protein
MQTIWNRPPIFKREGGSVPVVSQFQQILGVESVNTGFAMPDDNVHSQRSSPTFIGASTPSHFFFNLAIQILVPIGQDAQRAHRNLKGCL